VAHPPSVLVRADDRVTGCICAVHVQKRVAAMEYDQHKC
jgi:hypothetical protein